MHLCWIKVLISLLSPNFWTVEATNITFQLLIFLNLFFQIGSSKVGPDIRIPSNTIQNGPDAIVLYRSKSPPSKEGQNVPKSGLLDAVVYRTRGSDKKVSELTEALTPGQLPLLEDISALPDDETLSRCGPERLNLNAFRVRSSVSVHVSFMQNSQAFVHLPWVDFRQNLNFKMWNSKIHPW